MSKRIRAWAVVDKQNQVIERGTWPEEPSGDSFWIYVIHGKKKDAEKECQRLGLDGGKMSVRRVTVSVEES